MPTNGSTISLTGTLTKIKRGLDHKASLEVELDNIAYLNRSSVGLSSTSQRVSPFFILHIRTTSHFHPYLHFKESTTSFPTSRSRFNYNTTSPFANTPQPSPIPLGKRKQTLTDSDDDHPDPSTPDTKRSCTSSEKND